MLEIVTLYLCVLFSNSFSSSDQIRDRDFPIQEKMIHLCHATTSFPFVAKAVKALLSLRQRETFVMHNGSDETVLESLAQYSMPPHCVPTTLGE